MSNTIDPAAEREEIEMLLPWYVTGRLEASERQRVEQYLSLHPEMRRQLDLVEQERTETIAANEAIVPPRSLHADALQARISAASSSAVSGLASSLLAAISGFFSTPTAAGVRWATAAAALVVAVQMGVIGSLSTQLARQPGGATFTTASGGAASQQDGTYALVRFADSATAAVISVELLQRDMSIVEGPKPGGLYLVRIGPANLSTAERDAKIADLRHNKPLVVLVTPASR